MDNYVIVIDYSSVLNLTLTGKLIIYVTILALNTDHGLTPQISWFGSIACDSKFAILLNALRVSSYKYVDLRSFLSLTWNSNRLSCKCDIRL